MKNFDNSNNNDSNNDGDMISKLTYMYDDGTRPWLYAKQRTRSDPHKEDVGGNPHFVDVKIRNGRNKNHHLNLHSHSFELVRHPTFLKTSEFYQSSKVKDLYYEEIRQLVLKMTGASHVSCIHHQTRNGGGVGSGTDEKRILQQYATDIHTDTSPSDAENIFWDTLRQVESERGREYVERFREGRFLYVNAWRNIDDHNVIMDNHLALCDETSLVKPDDYIPYDYIEEGYTGTHTFLSSRNADKHRWYYFPRMSKDEVILFKQYDSDVHVPARMCFHASASDPRVTGAISQRQSIEVRCMAFFPREHVSAYKRPTEEEVRVTLTVSQLLQVIQYVHLWPKRDCAWFVKTMIQKGEEKGGTEVLEELVRDRRNDLGLKKSTPTFARAVKECALAEGFLSFAMKIATGLKDQI